MEALWAELSRVQQEARLLRQEMVSERQGDVRAPSSAAVSAPISDGVSGQAKKEQRLAASSGVTANDAQELLTRGVLTRPGPAGTWFVRFLDGKWDAGVDNDRRAGESKDNAGEGHKIAGKDTGGGEKRKSFPAVEAAASPLGMDGPASIEEQGPFPCTRDSCALMYPLVPILRPPPPMPQEALRADPAAEAAGSKSSLARTPKSAKAKQKTAAGEPPSASGDEARSGGESKSRTSSKAGVGEAGGIMDTCLRVAVARARLLVNVTSDMLVHWVSSRPSESSLTK